MKARGNAATDSPDDTGPLVRAAAARIAATWDADERESEKRRLLWRKLSRTARPRLLAAIRKEQRKRVSRIKKLETCDIEILAHALDTFESAEGAARWLTEATSQLAGLGGRAPVDVLGTKRGRDAVHQMLFRIDYGIPP